ncbi:unnamed protein product, partial [Ilex paraguariensis]
VYLLSRNQQFLGYMYIDDQVRSQARRISWYPPPIKRKDGVAWTKTYNWSNGVCRQSEENPLELYE